MEEAAVTVGRLFSPKGYTKTRYWSVEGDLTRMRHLEHYVPERLILLITPQAVINLPNRLGYDKIQTFPLILTLIKEYNNNNN